jgi:hypothetical protein
MGVVKRHSKDRAAAGSPASDPHIRDMDTSRLVL